MTAVSTNYSPQRTRAILLADKLTLSDRERRELAEWVVDHPGSWARLNEAKAKRLADAMDCFLGMQALLAMRTATGRRL